jgi:hypothetical protein
VSGEAFVEALVAALTAALVEKRAFGHSDLVDERHLGRAGIGEAGIGSRLGEGLAQGLCAIHRIGVLSLYVGGDGGRVSSGQGDGC